MWDFYNVKLDISNYVVSIIIRLSFWLKVLKFIFFICKYWIIFLVCICLFVFILFEGVVNYYVVVCKLIVVGINFWKSLVFW